MTMEFDGANPLFDGVIEPSEQAYKDTMEDTSEESELDKISIRKYEESSYYNPEEDDIDISMLGFTNFRQTVNYEVCYKNEPIWSVEIHSMHAGCSSLCTLLSNGRIGVFLNDENGKREKRFLDVKSLIKASGMAYQLDEDDDDESMVHIRYIVRKKDNPNDEDVLCLIVSKDDDEPNTINNDDLTEIVNMDEPNTVNNDEPTEIINKNEPEIINNDQPAIINKDEPEFINNDQPKIINDYRQQSGSSGDDGDDDKEGDEVRDEADGNKEDEVFQDSFDDEDDFNNRLLREGVGSYDNSEAEKSEVTRSTCASKSTYDISQATPLYSVAPKTNVFQTMETKRRHFNSEASCDSSETSKYTFPDNLTAFFNLALGWNKA